MADYQISSNGIKALKGSEGLRLKAYQDRKGVWTIGYGHTGYVNGKPVGPGMIITEKEAEDLFRQRLPEFENAVRSSVRVPLTQNQYDVLVSLAYNIGGNGLKNSGLIKKLNSGDYQGAADALLEYNKVRDQKTKQLEFDKGVFNRRKREREMFLGVGKGQAPDIPMPIGNEEHYYHFVPTMPQKNQLPDEWLSSFSFPAEQPTNPLQAFTDGFNQLNGTLDAFAPPEEPAIDYKKKYQKELANAFGVEPSTKDMIPDHIGDLMRSIYDKTT